MMPLRESVGLGTTHVRMVSLDKVTCSARFEFFGFPASERESEYDVLYSMKI